MRQIGQHVYRYQSYGNRCLDDVSTHNVQAGKDIIHLFLKVKGFISTPYAAINQTTIYSSDNNTEFLARWGFVNVFGVVNGTEMTPFTFRSVFCD